MRTTVEIDADLMEVLKDRGVREGQSLRKVLNAALRRGLASPKHSQLKRQYKCPVFSLGSPQGPTINLDKALSLSGAMEDLEVIREMELRK